VDEVKHETYSKDGGQTGERNTKLITI